MPRYIHGETDPAEVARLETQARFLSRWILDGVEVGPSARLLDLACGTGAMSRRLRARFPDAKLVGSDLSLDQMRTARDEHRRRPALRGPHLRRGARIVVPGARRGPRRGADPARGPPRAAAERHALPVRGRERQPLPLAAAAARRGRLPRTLGSPGRRRWRPDDRAQAPGPVYRGRLLARGGAADHAAHARGLAGRIPAQRVARVR